MFPPLNTHVWVRTVRERQALCEKTKSSWQLWESHETTKQRHSKGFYKRLNLGELSGRAIEVSLPVIVSKVVQLNVNTWLGDRKRGPQTELWWLQSCESTKKEEAQVGRLPDEEDAPISRERPCSKGSSYQTKVTMNGPVRTGHCCGRKASLGGGEVSVVMRSRDQP